MYLEERILSRQFNPNIKDSMNYIQEARDILTNIKVPREFRYCREIENMKSNLKERNVEIKNFYKDICAYAVKVVQAEKKNKSIIDSVIDASSISVATNLVGGGADKITDTVGNIVDDVKETPVGEFTEDVWNSAPVKFVKNIYATRINIQLSIDRGILNLEQNIFDFALSGITKIASVFTTIYDKTIDSSVTDKMEKESMCFIATDNVENVYNYLYKKTDIGKELDKNTFKNFKSDEVGCEMTANVTESLIPLLLEFIPGLGKFISPVVSFTSEAGKSVRNSNLEQMNNSWEGIKMKYRSGQMSKKEYEEYKSIRNMTKEQWKEIEKNYKSGKISKKEFKELKNIRELPEKWKNIGKDHSKALLGAGVSGLWGIINNKASSKEIEIGGKVIKTALNVAKDGGISSLDTSIDAFAESIATGKSYKESWKDQGGTDAMKTNAVKGMISGYASDKIGDFTKSGVKKVTSKARTKVKNVKIPKSTSKIALKSTTKKVVKNIDSVKKVAKVAKEASKNVASNALNTPVDTLIDYATSRDSLTEAWENQGGEKAMITNITSGLIKKHFKNSELKLGKNVKISNLKNVSGKFALK